MTQDQLDAIKGIVALFENAESKVKEVEQLAQDLSIPSINELRYVGYHLARALCENDDNQLSLQIEKARGHCKRAIYDAHEIGIIYMLEQIKLFKESYKTHACSVLEVIPAYTDELSNASKASKFITQIQEQNRDDRDNYYEACVPYYETLRDIIEKLSVSEPLINTRINEKAAKDRKDTRRFITTISLSVLGITITATLLYLKISS